MDAEKKIALNTRTQLMIAYHAVVQSLIYAQEISDREVSCILADAHISDMEKVLKSAINELTTTYQFKNPW